MELNIEPNEKKELNTEFSKYKQYMPGILITLKINKIINGDLSFFESKNGQGITTSILAPLRIWRKENFNATMFSFVSNKGCKAEYTIYQLGKIITE